jgi:hypothetical protein
MTKKKDVDTDRLTKSEDYYTLGTYKGSCPTSGLLSNSGG